MVIVVLKDVYSLRSDRDPSDLRLGPSNNIHHHTGIRPVYPVSPRIKGQNM